MAVKLAVAAAEIVPATVMSCTAVILMLPPFAPEALSLPVAVCTTVTALSRMLPPGSGERVLPGADGSTIAALIVPLFSIAGAVSATLPAGLPSVPAFAAMVPLLSIRSLASSTMRPPLVARPVASKVPELLTTPPNRWSTACAERMMRPPGASTAPLFSTSAAMVDGFTVMPAR